MDKCYCGGVILADTEDWGQPLCHEHYCEFLGNYQSKLREYESGFKGACPTCEPVGELNKELQSKLKEIHKSYSELREEYIYELEILRDSYNQLCDDLQRGEHVEMSWVRDSINDAAHSRMSKVYQAKIQSLQSDNQKLTDMNQSLTERLDIVEELLHFAGYKESYRPNDYWARYEDWNRDKPERLKQIKRKQWLKDHESGSGDA